MNRLPFIIAVLVVQLVCAFFFVGQIVATILGINIGPFDWALYELIEIGAALGLILGVGLGAMMLRRSLAETRKARTQLAELSGAFMDHIDNRFGQWDLTKAERDVALFVVKGMGTAEIAGLRGTSEGTVKAQTNAIYRKAGVANRGQFISHFIEDLMQDDLVDQSAE